MDWWPVLTTYLGQMALVALFLWRPARPRLLGEWIGFGLVVTFWPIFLAWAFLPSRKCR